MMYVSGGHALNMHLPGDDTPGDWHSLAIDWSYDKLFMRESEGSVFGDWGISEGITPAGDRVMCANHIRACLDYIEAGSFGKAGQMQHDYIVDDDLIPLIFEKVALLRDTERWSDVDDFMVREYKQDWIDSPYHVKKEWDHSMRIKNVPLHYQIIEGALAALNEGQDTPFILKGGNALHECYGLDRISENLDFDAVANRASHERFRRVIEQYCKDHGYGFYEKKDTDTAQRCNIHYTDDQYLKVEASYRSKSIRESDVTVIDGIKTFSINKLCEMKCQACHGRDRIRDLYDLAFIVNKYHDELTPTTWARTTMVLGENSFDYYNYLVETQDPEYVDLDNFESSFLGAHELVEEYQETH